MDFKHLIARLSLVATAAIILASCATTPPPPALPAYTMADFASVRKFDAHVHINVDDPAAIEEARQQGFELVSINVDYGDFPGIARQAAVARALHERFPDRFHFAVTFSMDGWGERGWARRVKREISAARSQGALAVKIWKNVGMDVRDKSGRLVMIDDPGFDPVTAHLRSLGMPLIGHQGEPHNCWLPLDQMTTANDRAYFAAHPQFHMYLHPEMPSYEEQMSARDRMLKRNRGLTFVGAHAASIEWNVDRLARFLDAFPKAHVDLAARMAQFQHQSVRDHARVRDFFIRYQDRILYGTDLTHNPGLDGAEFRAAARKRWLSDWQYLATSESQRIADIDADAAGLALPRSVIDKIYNANARRVFAPTRVPPAAIQSVTYEADDSDFANPERGFSRSRRQVPVDPRTSGMSLLHLYFRLDEFKQAPLPAAFLKLVRDRFDEVRALGVKAVPRFTYSFPRNEDYSNTDAPLPRVLAHLDQLAPVLADNSDVIAFMEAGFIGAWGEWHHSTNGLETPAAKAAVLGKLLRVLPSSRAVALRYQRDKQAIFGRTRPIDPAEAFTGTDVARVGHHNDCFLASADNWGTYRPHDAAALAAQKAYLRAENRFLPQGGETCNANRDAEPFIQCPNALKELAYLRWSQLNADYHPAVIKLWHSQGCWTEIARRLGYRLRLIDSSFPAGTAPGGPLRAAIRITNDGFAAPYNARGLELVLRNRGSAREYALGLTHDPRRWGAGETHDIAVAGCLPPGMEPGQYDAFINLPDPAPRLRHRPEYSIRLANLGVWEPATGYNALRVSTSVQGRALPCRLPAYFETRPGKAAT